ncbi:flagellar assembly protein A [Campylobacter aviculae]|uniref:DUF342 domain-containing protein n=1 Tax=Campylobacter aviculae TaxID=2510190 RepID=A0A4U7BQB9_9BACT|nr:flagellar assembly protein A [Campylobacter aviculae]TKX32450.1 DUF342 domain-containing protein [Campylobacter aviculae]
MTLDEKIISYTENPTQELLEVSSRTSINSNELDFNLLAFSTQYCFSDNKWEKISEKDLNFFEKDEVFLRNDLQIKQEYKIEIFHNNTNQDNFSKAIKLVANKNLTKIVAQIDFSILEYHEKLALELLQNIYKKMLKLKFLIGIRIFDFKKELIAICNQHKKNPLNKTIQLVVTKGIDPEQSQDEKLILLYKEKTTNYTTDEKRSGIIAVDENEVVLRHAKFKQGKEGKNLNLHTLKVLSANENKVQFTCSPAFKAVDQENFTDYIALKKGFVIQDGDRFDIGNFLEFRGVDFKNIGIIRAGLDKDIKIDIKFVSDMQDAVNSGVGIECEELNIAGNVGSNTHLKATKMKIEGITHSKAQIYAKEGYIKTHRGFAEGEKLSVDLLEGGTIKAKEVKIKKSLGGTIQADKIYIENLENNNTCVFYDCAVVEYMKGQNNKFNIKVKTLDKDYDKEFLQIKERISTLNHKISKLKHFISSSKNGVLNIEKKVAELKNQGKNIPPQYEKILKEFSLQNNEFNKLQNEEKEVLELKKKLHSELLVLEKTLFDAKFINKNGKWSEMNEIRFSLIEPKKDIFYSSFTNESAKFIGLEKRVENNQELIEIRKKLDYDQKDIEWLSPSKE